MHAVPWCIWRSNLRHLNCEMYNFCVRKVKKHKTIDYKVLNMLHIETTNIYIFGLRTVDHLAKFARLLMSLAAPSLEFSRSLLLSDLNEHGSVWAWVCFSTGLFVTGPTVLESIRSRSHFFYLCISGQVGMPWIHFGITFLTCKVL